MAAADWLEQLEARLEHELEAFLAANPAQRTLLREQEARDRQAELVGERSRLQRQAEQERQRLLALAAEIRAWRQRVERARAAGAHELAARAEAHGAALMEQGRHSWSQLADLGQRFAAVEGALRDLATAQAAAARPAAGAAAGAAVAGEDPDLERAWATFEAEQELERLRRPG